MDLNCLNVVSRESFEGSITTLSQVHEGVPLTVGTSFGIHLHDFRARARVDRDACASLVQPTPISILHLPQPGSHSLVSNDLYVAGRFPNILHYDRRKFPALVDSIYSGALVKSLTALPYPFSPVKNEVRRQGDLPAEQVSQMKHGTGRTLIAGGGYKTKGSLELYGLSSSGDSLGATLPNSTTKNRYTAADSTILSVISHGTKILISDGSGWLRWFERDGITEVRRHKIGHGDTESLPSMSSSDELARKILSTQSEHGQNGTNNNGNNVLFWTGEKLGMVSFTTGPIYQSEDFEAEDTYRSAVEEERRLYNQRIREALERQANEVKFISSLGLGARSR